MAIAIQAEVRQTKTKAELRQLRANGKIPGVVFGSQVGSIPISIDEKTLHPILSKHARSILEMEVPGKGKQSVIIGEVQRDPIVGKLLHVDFHQFNTNEEMKAEVKVDYTGTAAGVKAGGIKTVIKDTVEIKCMPEHLPVVIEVDISELEIGDNLTAAQISLPEHVSLITDPKEVLLSISAQQKAEEDSEASETAEVAE